MSRIAVIAILALTSCISTALAQPSVGQVSGTVASGEVITIVGAGFGPKDRAAPILWEDFEGGNAGADLSTDPRWPSYLSASTYYNDGSFAINGPNYNVTPYNGSLFVSNRVCGPDAPAQQYANDDFGTNNFFFAPTDTVYYSYMVRWDVYDVAADNYGIAKFGRTNAAPNRYNGTGLLGVSSMNPNSGGGLYALYTPDESQISLGYVANPPRSEWRRHELYKVNGTPGVANGTVTVDMLRTSPVRQVDREGDIETRGAGQDFKQTNIILGTMVANVRNDGDIMISIDDVYIDNTRARVEIGDNSSFYACTYREIQIPEFWASGQISVVVNVGRLDPNSPAFLFVVDEAGRVSNGFQVEINGEAQDPGPPGMPSEIVLELE